MKQNIKWLEDININVEKSMNDLKLMLDNINKEKEKLIISVQEIFTKLRNEINKREDELLMEIDEKYKNIISDENMEKQNEKLPKTIKDLIEKGKLIEKDWDKNNLNSTINDCIKIEKKLIGIKNINDNLKAYQKNQNNKFIFNLNDNDIKDILEKISSFGNISVDGMFKFKFKKKIIIHYITMD